MRHPWRGRYILVAFLLLGFIASYGQQKYIPSETAESRSIRSVISIGSDRSGYLWLSTNYGLVRFDGKSFLRMTRYNDSRISANVFGRSSWILKTGDWLFRDDLKNFLMPDGHGNLASRDTVISFLKRLLPDGKLLDSLSVSSDCIISGKNEAYTIYGPTLQHRRAGHTVVIKRNINFEPRQTFFSFSGSNIFFNAEGKVFLLQGDSIKLVEVQGLPDQSASHRIHNDIAGQLFLVSDDHLYRCRFRNGILTAESIPGLPPIAGITGIHEDRISGKLFIASIVEGLRIFKPELFRTFALDGGRKNSDYYYATTRVGNDYFSVSGKHIVGFNGETSKVIYESSKLGSIILSADRLGRIWFQETAGQLWYLRKTEGGYQSQKVFQFPYEIRQVSWFNGGFWVLTNSAFYRMVENSDGTLVVGRRYPYSMKFGDVQIGSRAYVFHFAGKSRVLVGFNTGILSLDLQKGQWDEIREFSGISIRSIEQVEGLGILAGSYGDGYFLISKGKVLKMPMDREGRLNSVHSFIRDKRGYLWMPTNEGIVRASVGELAEYVSDHSVSPSFRIFNERDGLLSNEFNGGCNPAYVVSGDTVVVPSTAGLVMFLPNNFRDVANPPVTLYQTIGDSTFRVSAGIEISSDQLLQFRFGKVNHANPSDDRIWYRLIPGNGKWTGHYVNEPLLPGRLKPGEYQIELSGVQPTLKSNQSITQYLITVSAIWYEDPYLLVIGFLALMALMVLLVRLRLYSEQRRQEILEYEIELKTRQLGVVNHELQRRNRELEESMGVIRDQVTFREKMLLVLLHDLKSPMRFVNTSLRQLFTGLGSGTPARALSGELVTSVSGIYKFMEDFHNWVLRSGTGKPDFISIRELLDGIREFYEQVAEVRGNQIQIECEDLVIKTYGFTLKSIIGNLVDNALKNTTKGKVLLLAYDTRSFVNIEVIDTGSGMRQETVLNILESLDSRNFENAPSMGSGVGYSLIAEFLRKAGGLICLESETGKGTRVTISIPKAHVKTNSAYS